MKGFNPILFRAYYSILSMPLGLFGLLSEPLCAQEFWMMPDKYVYSTGIPAVIKFGVGNDFISETWNLRLNRVKRVSAYKGTDKPLELRDHVKEGKRDHLPLATETPGTYVVVMETFPAFVELQADKFNKYLQDYALGYVYQEREEKGELQKPGKELYARNTKLIFQVGETRTENYKINAGMPLEFVPQSNPVDFKVGDRVQFKLYSNKQPLAGVRVFVWNRKDHRTYTQPIYSQDDGTVEVRIFNDGSWMLSAVWMERSEDAMADWQSFWGSCVFSVNYVEKNVQQDHVPSTKNVRD